MTLEYSPDALEVRPNFFESGDEVTFIVEDMNNESVYDRVLRRLFEECLDSFSVIGLGGKDKVLADLIVRSTNSELGRRFYLIDGDFDELLGIEPDPHPRLFQLTRYDIEAHLIDELAVSIIAADEDPSKSESTHLSEMDVERRIAAWFEQVICLVAAYVAIQRLGLPIDNANQRIYRFLGEDQRSVSTDAIELFVSEARAVCDEIDTNLWSEAHNSASEAVGPNYQSWRRWVSGKNILLPLLSNFISWHCQKRGLRPLSVSSRLALHADLSSLHDLRKRVGAEFLLGC